MGRQDVHVHLERGPYTLAWVARFAQAAAARGIDELWLLEHSYRFREFLPMYEDVRRDPFVDTWLARKGGTAELDAYAALADAVRGRTWPVRLRFGLEICFCPGKRETVRRAAAGRGFDFLVGSVHFAGGFAFDHRPELWDGRDADEVWRAYCDESLAAADSGLFDGLAHPDLCKIFGHQPSFPLEEWYEALAGRLAARGMYTEENSGAHRRAGGRRGMEPGLLAALRRSGVTVRTASDAHSPEDVGEGVAEAEKKLGI